MQSSRSLTRSSRSYRRNPVTVTQTKRMERRTARAGSERDKVQGLAGCAGVDFASLAAKASRVWPPLDP